MDNSILNNIKKLLGIDESYTAFDTDIIIHINSVFSSLKTMGIGPSEGFSIEDNTKTWSDFIWNNSSLEMIKTYVYMKVKLLFDPPQSASVIESYNKEIKELEYRMYTEEGGY